VTEDSPAAGFGRSARWKLVPIPGPARGK
jgi:hypothetical protein